MPQMSPMMWLALLLYMISLMNMVMIKNYYTIFTGYFYAYLYTNKHYIKYKKNFNKKW